MTTPHPERFNVIIFEYLGNRFGLAIQAIEAISHVYPDERQKLPKALMNQQSLFAADVKEVIFRRAEDMTDLRDLSILDITAVAQRITPTSRDDQAA